MVEKLEILRDDVEYLYEKTTGTFKIGSLQDVTYDDIIRTFGVPSIFVPSGDNKVQLEWVIEFNGDIFTIYDWKTYDRDYTLQELTVWSIGGKSSSYDFLDLLTSLLAPKAIVS
jgi:ABC-type Fe3+-hydroxamate transport system substrate-binding protein